MKHCSYFIGRTDWDRRISGVLSPGRIYFHCDELIRTEFYKSEHWEKPKNPRIRLLSTLSAMSYKGLETVLETAESLKKSELLDIEWRIVGIKGSEEIVQIIEKAYQRKFVDYNVKFIGNQGPDALISELLCANCYIHPSHIENSPNSVCEAMLLGMPVIATYAGGTSSLITNDVDGLLVQDGDPYSMAGAIYELCRNEKLISKISENARLRALVRHNPETIISDLASAYNKVLSDFS